MKNMENNLDTRGQQDIRKTVENKQSQEKMRGKIVYNFMDGSVGIFDTVEELIEARKTERDNYN